MEKKILLIGTGGTIASEMNENGLAPELTSEQLLRYIPDIQRDFHNISQAQQARGVELGKKEKLISRLKNSVNILLPLILSSLQRIDIIANAMSLRCFGKDPKKRTWYTKRPFGRNDYIALGIGLALLIASIVITFWDGDRYFNPFV